MQPPTTTNTPSCLMLGTMCSEKERKIVSICEVCKDNLYVVREIIDFVVGYMMKKIIELFRYISEG